MFGSSTRVPITLLPGLAAIVASAGPQLGVRCNNTFVQRGRHRTGGAQRGSDRNHAPWGLPNHSVVLGGVREVFHLTLDGPICVHATTHDKPAASLGSRKGNYHA